jgi:Skp family chaperone for outer membrane proteins
MQKIFTLAAIVFFCGSAFGQSTLSKEEKKRLKDELKGYSSDLEGYSAKMADIRSTLDSNDAEIKRLKDDLAYAATVQAELENKVAAYDAKLNECETARNSNPQNAAAIAKDKQSANPVIVPSDKYAESYKQGKTKGTSAQTTETTTSNNSGSSSTSGGVMGTNLPKNSSGVVYKVQIGLYKEFSINKYFEEPRYIGYEDVDGMNRYIISYFPEEQIAEDFVKDIRKMGIKDAFVSKYIDGQRVYEWSKNPKYAGKKEPNSLQEALEMEKKAKKKPANSGEGN